MGYRHNQSQAGKRIKAYHAGIQFGGRLSHIALVPAESLSQKQDGISWAEIQTNPDRSTSSPLTAFIAETVPLS